MAMKNPHINSDYEMAEALEVEQEAILRAKRQYELQGFDVRRPAEWCY
jgi:hypothetical protein